MSTICLNRIRVPIVHTLLILVALLPTARGWRAGDLPGSRAAGGWLPVARGERQGGRAGGGERRLIFLSLTIKPLRRLAGAALLCFAVLGPADAQEPGRKPPVYPN